MVDAFYADNNRFQVVKNDDIAFDSERPSIQLFPDSAKISTSLTISFPNLLSSATYLNRSVGGAGTTYCESWSGLQPQEWGPDESDVSPTWFPGQAYPGPIRRNLPQQAIGTVPAGTDYIDVRANLVRTTVPPTFQAQSPPVVLFAEGQWIGLPGGSCPCEMFYPLMRHFDIVLSPWVDESTPRTVYLRRFQSTAYAGVLLSWVQGGNVSGWHRNSGPSYGGYNNDLYEFQIPSVRMDVRGPDPTANKRPPWYTGAGNSCAVGVVDYSSAYSAQIEIHPGRYLAGS